MPMESGGGGLPCAGGVARLALVVLLLATSLACRMPLLGLPRVAMSSTSPDGRFVAVVRNHPTIDPPDQSIWVGEAGGRLRRVEQLFPDMDWCQAIAWSADSSTVAFVIRRARLRVVRAATGETVYNAWVFEWTGEYPPAIAVKDLALSADGTTASFRGCDRYGDCSGFQTVDLTR